MWLQSKLGLLTFAVLAFSGCGAKKPLVVGSKTDADQRVLAEITSQHVEHRLNIKVQRRPGVESSLALYQAGQSGDVSIYPELTGTVASVVLNEPSPADPAIALERVRNEMLRTAQLEVFGPVGYDNPTVIVVKSTDADAAKISSLGQAADSAKKWKPAVSFQFQQTTDGIPALSSYKIPMEAPIRGMDSPQLFPALDRAEVTMIATPAMDGHLNSPDYKILADDRKVFPPNQAILLVRQNILTEYPQLRAALTELNGKLDDATVRRLTGEIEVGHRSVEEIAAQFLSQAGLK